MADLYVALVHHPVYDKHGNIVTASITTIDVHDIARSCRTYGVNAFYIVTPVDALRGLARRILEHWKTGHGSRYNPTRTEALEIVRLERTLEGVEIDIEAETGHVPRLVATSAREGEGVIGYEELRRRIDEQGPPLLLLLGTGWGLAGEVLSRAAYRLAPVRGPSDFNHLSVRAAAAVILDRLRGTR
ncbi:MAG: RNA methyltransferase [Deltaproteobacteria bacterium]|nr:MAG: RNA methyltransferase [Deltaproteobacteria bacterium]